MRLDKGKRYSVLRTGENTTRCAQGDSFNICFFNQSWRIYENGEQIYSAGTNTFLNSKYWEIEYCLDEHDLQGEQEKEYSMSFDKVQQEALVVEMGVIMVNGSRLDKFTDEALIGMVKAERKKLAILSEDVGAGSKYYQAKKVGMEANVAILLDALDRRVDS